LLQESFVMKICLSLKTERQLILCWTH
jgi:hypothetical protein